LQRSFVAKTTVNFPDHELYVRVGDTLVYNAANDNSLTVYRAGAIIKTIKTTPISIAAMTKTKMIVEMGTPAPKQVVKSPPASSPASKAAVKPKSIPKKSSVVPKSDCPLVGCKKVGSHQHEIQGPAEVEPKSKSEAKRIAAMKGEDPMAAAEKIPQKSLVPENTPSGPTPVSIDWKDPVEESK